MSILKWLVKLIPQSLLPGLPVVVAVDNMTPTRMYPGDKTTIKWNITLVFCDGEEDKLYVTINGETVATIERGEEHIITRNIDIDYSGS